jgi:hypothetical protein
MPIFSRVLAKRLERELCGYAVQLASRAMPTFVVNDIEIL